MFRGNKFYVGTVLWERKNICTFWKIVNYVLIITVHILCSSLCSLHCTAGYLNITFFFYYIHTYTKILYVVYGCVRTFLSLLWDRCTRILHYMNKKKKNEKNKVKEKNYYFMLRLKIIDLNFLTY